MSRLLHDRPVAAVLGGVVCTAFSGILFRISHVSPSTGAFYRCAWALIPLALIMAFEDRRFPPRPLRARVLAWIAGVFFALDLVFWHRAIDEVGAGLATVLGNMQIVIVPLVAWAVLRERVSWRLLAAIPIALMGVVLISGAFEHGAYGRNPGLGVAYGVLTAFVYSAFLLILRRGNSDTRRPAGPLFDATLAAALACLLLGLAFRDFDPLPSARAQGWLILLALTSQVIGWLLISITLPRLPAAMTSLLLMAQPVLTVIFAALLLSESPSTLQIVGMVAILGALAVASSGRLRRRQAASDAPVVEPQPGQLAEAGSIGS